MRDYACTSNGKQLQSLNPMSAMIVWIGTVAESMRKEIKVSTRFRQGVENERAGAGRNSLTHHVRPTTRRELSS